MIDTSQNGTAAAGSVRGRRRALITGITGQDGVLLAEKLLAQGYAVIGFGRRESILSRNDLRPLMSRIDVFHGDLDDAVDVAEAVQRCQPDELYNLASQSAPSLSWARALETGQVTGLGAHRVYEAVRRFKPDCRVYQASSSEMYGLVRGSPQDETTPFNPSNPYAAAKVYAHQMAGIYRRSYGMFICCGILFNHESPWRAMRYLSQKITYGAACAKLGICDSTELNEEGEPIVLNGKLRLGNQDAARDWGHARDYVEAMWRMLQCDVPADYVVGTGVLRSVREMCDVAYRCVDLDWRDHVVTDARLFRPTETGATVADATKARLDLAWRPTCGFDEMVGEMVEANLRRIAKASRTGSPHG